MSDDTEEEPNCSPVYFTASQSDKKWCESSERKSANATNAANHESLPKLSGDESKKEYSEFDIVRATQYGAFERCKELVENGHDVNERDAENVTLLHWASINNRRDIVKYYIGKGAILDAIGGDLHSTPLHWATRQGHLSMVILLIQHRADPSILDGEGSNCLHLAAQFGHTAIVAYLVAKGEDINAPDINGMTPLMWSAFRVNTNDPTRLLITLGASLSLFDSRHRNTALHWAVYSRNSTSVSLLLKAGANVLAKNVEDDTPLDMANKLQCTWLAKRLEEPYLEKEMANKHIIVRLFKDKAFRYWFMFGSPFVAFYLFGANFNAEYALSIKLIVLLVLIIVSMTVIKYSFDSRIYEVLPISLYLSTKFWLYVTSVTYFVNYLSLPSLLGFLFTSTWLFYSFFQTWQRDPGIVFQDQQQRFQTIMDLAEREGFDPNWFCSSCVVRKPLRSKHCSKCGQCVARFDHHCPWVGNCVGYGNHRYFIAYLIALFFTILWFLYSTYIYWRHRIDSQFELNFSKFLYRSLIYDGWLTWCAVNAAIHSVWVFCLSVCQLYQILWLGMTTNERMNCRRYHHFKRDEHGNISSPFNRGFWQNFFDFFELKFCRMFRPDSKDWRFVYDVDESDSVKSSYQYV